MAEFFPAVEILLAQEGGYCVDCGGPTNYGITLPVLRSAALDNPSLIASPPHDITAEDIKNLTRDQAISIWRALWWEPFSYSLINSQAIANKVLSLSANIGPHQAHLLLQRAILAAEGPALRQDGIFGPLTLAATNASPTAPLLAALRSEAGGFYRLLVAVHEAYHENETGWLARAYS